MHGDLNKLINYIKNLYPFDGSKYPELKGADEQRQLVFGLRHLSLHFAKTAGKIAAVSESVDHGGEIDIQELQKDVSKSLINTLRLAELVGVTEADMIKAIEEKYKAPIV